MKKIQSIILAVTWVFLLTAIGRVLVHMFDGVKTLEQGLTMFAFVVFIGFLMYMASILIIGLVRESFGRQ
jgi:uncharacterized PurR-regulated membrane protein YhhQ (DUF165 family)